MWTGVDFFSVACDASSGELGWDMCGIQKSGPTPRPLSFFSFSFCCLDSIIHCFAGGKSSAVMSECVYPTQWPSCRQVRLIQ